jgi:FkbM family methyltransferase
MSDKTSHMRKVKINGQEFWFIDDSKFNKFFDKLAAGIWEPDTFKFLEANLDRKTVYFDVGSWIGVTPAYASKLAKHVVSIEPEPFCIDAIQRTISANSIDNVTLIPAALSAEKSTDLFMVGGGGSSITSLVPAKGVESVNVKGVQPEYLIGLAGEDQFVLKIDIEGFEYLSASLIKKFGQKNLRAVQLALHPATVAQKSVVPWLFGRITAAAATRKLVVELSHVFGPFTVRNYSSLAHYLIAGIILNRKCKGTEVEFLNTRST